MKISKHKKEIIWKHISEKNIKCGACQSEDLRLQDSIFVHRVVYTDNTTPSIMFRCDNCSNFMFFSATHVAKYEICEDTGELI